MKTRPIALALMTLFATPFAFAEELANPDSVPLLKTFAPPKPIAPNVAQGYFPENQFDRTDRSAYYFVTENIDQAMRPVKINSGVYGKNFYNSVSAQVRGANFYGMANINHTKANGYKDGDGREVDWGYTRFNQALVLGYVPSANQEYRLTYLHDDINDDKQPHFANDAVNTDRHVAKLNARWGNADLSNTVQAEVGLVSLERRADNFSLRQPAPQSVFVDLDRKIWQFSLKHDADFGQFHNTASLSYQHDTHNGERSVHTPVRDFKNGYRFADVRINRWRLADTLSYKFNDQHKFSLGLSYETNRADVRKNTAQFANPMMAGARFASAQQIWQQHYGYTFNGKVRQNAFSGELKYDFTPNEYQKYSVSAGYIERIGDNMERFNSLAAIVQNPMGVLNNQKPTAAIVGNPLLKPEQHRFIKFTADSKNETYQGYMNSLLDSGWNVGGTIMLDKVRDLIIYDRARRQSGVASSGGGIITRNVDATLFTANAYANYNFNANWAAGAKVFYNYGNNDSDNRPLYQVRPFELSLHADYRNYFSAGSYNVGVAARYVGKQTRGDFDVATGLGIDKRAAAKSFVTTDVYAGLNFHDKYGVRVGVNNVFNKRYAEFLSGDHVLALSPTSVVNAPGRTFWLSVHAAF